MRASGSQHRGTLARLGLEQVFRANQRRRSTNGAADHERNGALRGVFRVAEKHRRWVGIFGGEEKGPRAAMPFCVWPERCCLRPIFPQHTAHCIVSGGTAQLRRAAVTTRLNMDMDVYAPIESQKLETRATNVGARAFRRPAPRGRQPRLQNTGASQPPPLFLAFFAPPINEPPAPRSRIPRPGKEKKCAGDQGVAKRERGAAVKGSKRLTEHRRGKMG